MKYCDKCGAQITEGMTTCPSCGVAVTAPVAATPVTPSPAQAMEAAAQAAAPTPVVVEAQPAPAPIPVAEPAAQPVAAMPTPVAPIPQQPIATQVAAPVAPATSAPAKSGGMPVILAIILILVAAGGGLLMGKVLFGSAKPAELVVNDHTADEKEEENEEDIAQLSANTEAYISGHKITIPSDRNFEVDDEDVLYVYDDTQEWISEITLTQFLYSNITGNINTIINNFKSSGITVEGYEEKVISGLDLVEIKLVDPSGIKILAAYVKVSDAYVGVLSVYNQTSEEYETERFTEAVEILATAERSTTSRDMATTNKNNAMIDALPVA